MRKSVAMAKLKTEARRAGSGLLGILRPIRKDTKDEQQVNRPAVSG
jgi:hypothetical protein